MSTKLQHTARMWRTAATGILADSCVILICNRNYRALYEEWLELRNGCMCCSVKCVHVYICKHFCSTHHLPSRVCTWAKPTLDKACFLCLLRYLFVHKATWTYTGGWHAHGKRQVGQDAHMERERERERERKKEREKEEREER